MVYNKMAAVYDRFMETAPYEHWTSFTKEMVKTYHPNAKSMIDLGCGTGQITLLLKQLGFQMTGVDLASDMLTVAQHQAVEQNMSIQWIQQDLNTLDVGTTYDVAISYCDVMNYITSSDEVHQVFTNVFQTLNEEGLFIFDVHAMGHVKHTLQDNTFSEIYDDMGYVWFCDAGDYEGEMYHEMTFFVKDHEQYDRFDEQHHQRTYHAKDYLTWLQAVGFKAIGLCADFDSTFISPEEADRSERMFIICKK